MYSGRRELPHKSFLVSQFFVLSFLISFALFAAIFGLCVANFDLQKSSKIAPILLSVSELVSNGTAPLSLDVMNLGLISMFLQLLLRDASQGVEN